MEISTICEQLQRMREKTEQAIRGSKQLMEETRILLEQSRASCRTSRTLLEALEESLISDKVNWAEFDENPSAPSRS